MNDCHWYSILACDGELCGEKQENCTNCKYYISGINGIAIAMNGRRNREMDELLKPLYAKDKEQFEAYKKEQESKE